MATTTNFGFETPDDTDLVKDGALAMRTLGDNIDARFGNVATYPNQIVNVISGVSRPVPFAMTVGTAAPVWTASTNSAALTVTFPASRFTQPPAVFITNVSATGSLIGSTYRPLSITAASFALNGAATAAITATGSVQYTAIQMTSASASG